MRILFAIASCLLLPVAAAAQGSITGTVKDTTGAVCRRHGRGLEPGPDRAQPDGGDGRHRSVPVRRPAAGGIRLDLHAVGVRHGQAGRRGVDRLLYRDRECRTASRRPCRNGHRHRRDADRGCAEREPPAGVRARRGGCDSDGEESVQRRGADSRDLDGLAA